MIILYYTLKVCICTKYIDGLVKPINEWVSQSVRWGMGGGEGADYERLWALFVSCVSEIIDKPKVFFRSSGNEAAADVFARLLPPLSSVTIEIGPLYVLFRLYIWIVRPERRWRIRPFGFFVGRKCRHLVRGASFVWKLEGTRIRNTVPIPLRSFFFDSIFLTVFIYLSRLCLDSKNFRASGPGIARVFSHFSKRSELNFCRKGTWLSFGYCAERSDFGTDSRSLFLSRLRPSFLRSLSKPAVNSSTKLPSSSLAALRTVSPVSEKVCLSSILVNWHFFQSHSLPNRSCGRAIRSFIFVFVFNSRDDAKLLMDSRHHRFSFEWVKKLITIHKYAFSRVSPYVPDARSRRSRDHGPRRIPGTAMQRRATNTPVNTFASLSNSYFELVASSQRDGASISRIKAFRKRQSE